MRKKLMFLPVVLLTLCSSAFAQLEIDPPVSDGFNSPVGQATSPYNPHKITQRFQEPDPNVYTWRDPDGVVRPHPGHLGDDIGMPVGTPVKAASKGVVVYAKNAGSGWGNVIIVKHKLPNGEIWFTQYAHLSQIAVSVRSVVSRGQQIGKSGTLGTGPHLHFEVKKSAALGNFWPGPGYSTSSSFVSNFTTPNKFITDRLTFNTRPYPAMATDAVPQVGNNADGRMSVLVRGSEGAIYHIRQTAINSGWATWENLKGTLAGNPMIGRNADGRLEFFVLGTNGSIYSKWQTSPNGGWSTTGGTDNSGWQDYSANVASNPAVGRNADGRLQFFVRGTDGAIYTKWQQSLNGNWSEWQNFGASGLQRDPAVSINADGRQELFARGGDGAIYFKWQREANGAWDNWGSKGGNVEGKPVVGRYPDGRLILLVRGNDGVIYYRKHDYPNGNWSDWKPFGQPFAVASNPAVAINKRGYAQVFVRGNNNAIYTTEINDSSIVPWTSLGGVLSSDPAVGVEQDGRLHVFAKGTDNLMYQRWQETSESWVQPWAELR